MRLTFLLNTRCRNACLMPVITLFAARLFSIFFSSSLLTESVFSIPGFRQAHRRRGPLQHATTRRVVGRVLSAG